MLDNVFMGDVREPFNTRRFAMARTPIEGFAYTPAKPNRPWESRNHWMIKRKDQNHVLLDLLEPDVRRFCQKAIDFMRAFRLPFDDRYLYLTVDDQQADPGNSQMASGWHFDGMQGSEVPTPNPGCFQFLWCDQTPTQYSAQKFQTKGLDRHNTNLIASLANQVRPECVKTVKPGMTYLISAYQLHRASQAASDGRRKLIRLTASHQPITSVKMTVNPLMDYDYPFHTTSGNIPSGLKVLYQKSEMDEYRIAV